MTRECVTGDRLRAIDACVKEMWGSATVADIATSIVERGLRSSASNSYVHTRASRLRARGVELRAHYNRGVPIDVVRQAFRDSGLTPSELAYRMNWFRGDRGRADDARIKRAVGILPFRKNGKSFAVLSTSSERACELIRACGFDPVDYDL